MKARDNDKLHSAIEEQASSHCQRQLTAFLRRLFHILFRLTRLIGLYTLLVSILLTLFQQIWQTTPLPFWQLIGKHMLEQNVIYLGIGLMFLDWFLAEC